jgi:EAL and modified HD-GYP domain-containing signal transduction protein
VGVLTDPAQVPTMASQAIVDASGREVGVELLFRHPPAVDAPTMRSEADHEYATTTVVDLLDAQLDDGSTGLLFLNAPRAFVVGEQPLPEPNDRIVVEVLEGVEADPDVVAGVQDLLSRGYKIAVDDWEGGEDRVALMEYADFVKIDLEAVTAERLRGIVVEARGLHPGITVVVERIETQDDMQAAVDAGADLFQGFLLATPDLVPPT